MEAAVKKVSTRDLIAPIIQRSLSAFLAGNMVDAISLDIADAVAVAVLARMGPGWRPIGEAIEAAKANNGWIGRSLFGKWRDWGWEEWVGQCDAGEWWLGRDGAGSCFETDVPTHYKLLDAAPAAPRSPAEGGS